MKKKVSQNEMQSAFDRIWQLIKENWNEFKKYRGVENVRPGYRVRNGWFVDQEPVIVFEVRQKLREEDLDDSQRIPHRIGEFGTDVVKSNQDLQINDPAEDDVAENKIFEEIEDDVALPGWDRESPSSKDKSKEEIDDSNLFQYQPPPDAHLRQVTDAMTVICHVSPDAGWKTLNSFLSNVKSKLTIGMYDFTAPHIIQSLNSGMQNATGNLSLVLDPKESLGEGTKANDTPELEMLNILGNTLGERFRFAWAAVGSKRVSQAIYPSAYHIKVAVKDGHSFWLSSGNWQSSNQPAIENLELSVRKILRSYNREWHIIIMHKELADTFERFLNWDLEQAASLQLEADHDSFVSSEEIKTQSLIPESIMDALEADVQTPKFFNPSRFQFNEDNPITIQPLLTPDNYPQKVLELIESAQHRIYFQNQSLKISKRLPKLYKDLLDALLAKIEMGIDVKIIIRDISDTRIALEALLYYGFDLSMVKVQPGCHTKGIIVDSEKVLLGSHNWTGQGTTQNRDASLIFYSPEIAQYFEEIFLFDWNNLARRKLVEEDADFILVESDEVRGNDNDGTRFVPIPWDSND